MGMVHPWRCHPGAKECAACAQITIAQAFCRGVTLPIIAPKTLRAGNKLQSGDVFSPRRCRFSEECYNNTSANTVPMLARNHNKSPGGQAAGVLDKG
jgi:hypothetical protein